MKKLILLALLLSSLMCAQTQNTVPASSSAAPPSAKAAESAPASPAAPVIPPPTAQKLMLMFSATDASGNPVANLSRSQVAINDNGQLDSISELKAWPDLPVDLGIIFFGKIDFGQQQNAAMELVKVLRPGKDRAFVMVAGGTKAVSAELPWASDQSALINQIKNLDRHVGYPDPFEYNVNRTSSGLERNTVQEYSADTTSFLDFAWKNFQSSPRFARRVLVVFRAPMGHAPGMTGRSRQAAELRQLHAIQGSQFFRTPIFIIGIEDLGMYLEGPKDIGEIHVSVNAGSGDASEMRSRDRSMQRVVEQQYDAGRINLNEIAADSGGRSWWGSHKDYAEAIAGIKAELTVPYLVSFVSTAPAEVHNIKVSAGSDVRVAVQQTIYQKMPEASTPPAEAESKTPVASH
jgi:hypothetical protein